MPGQGRFQKKFEDKNNLLDSFYNKYKYKYKYNENQKGFFNRFDDENVDADGKTKTFTYSKDETDIGMTSVSHCVLFI
jgi:hypothetical protein